MNNRTPTHEDISALTSMLAEALDEAVARIAALEAELLDLKQDIAAKELQH